MLYYVHERTKEILYEKITVIAFMHGYDIHSFRL